VLRADYFAPAGLGRAKLQRLASVNLISLALSQHAAIPKGIQPHPATEYFYVPCRRPVSGALSPAHIPAGQTQILRA
jgi:hypothetical protein